MAGSFEDRLRLTAERLRSERQRVATEKAEAVARNKAHLITLQGHSQEWARQILPRLNAAVETANHIVSEVQLKCTNIQGQTVAAVADIPSFSLPAVEVTERVKANSPPAPPRPARPTSTIVRGQEPKVATLRIFIDKNDNIVATKNNYKFKSVAQPRPVPFNEFKHEAIEDLVAELVNSGLLGHDPDVAEPDSTAQASGESGSAEPSSSTNADSDIQDSRPVVPSPGEVAGAIRNNHGTITLASQSLVALLDERIATLVSQIPNEEDAKAAWDRELQTYRNMREATQTLALAVRDFVTDNAKDKQAIDATLSFASGLQNWWKEKHGSICERGFDSGLFALGVMLCHYAGAGGEISAIISATVVKGQPVIDALKAWVASKNKSKEKD